MKKLFTVIFVIFISSAANAQTAGLKELSQLHELLSASYFDTTICAVRAFDLTDNKELYSSDDKYLLRPASNMKVLTTSTGLLFLGLDYEFKTDIFYTGNIENKILHGDLYIVGGFDPDFTYSDLQSLAVKVKEFGIDEINGNVFGDDSKSDTLLWGMGWMWDDDPSTDFPRMSSLVIDDAAVAIEVSAPEAGKPAVINVIPESDYFKIENTSKIVTEKIEREDRFQITRDWVNKSNLIKVSGLIKPFNGVDTLHMNIVHPQNYFVFLTEKALKDEGIKITGTTGLKELNDSTNYIGGFARRFDDVIVNLNKISDNLSAEMTLRALALKYYGKPALPENGTKMIDSMITVIGMNPENYRIVDGSGVSHYNLISAEMLSNILIYFYKENKDLYEILKHSFPIGGVDGTLKYRMKNSLAFENVHAKTGTLSGVSSLSGYLTTANNHEIAFSIVMQNFTGSSRKARMYQDKICEILCGIGE